MDLRGDGEVACTIRGDGGNGAMGRAIPNNFRNILPNNRRSTMDRSIRRSTMGYSILHSTKGCNSMSSNRKRSMDYSMDYRMNYNKGHSGDSNTMNYLSYMAHNNIRSCFPGPISMSRDFLRRLQLCLRPFGRIESSPCNFRG